MSEFVMGARLELTDDFSTNMTAASQTTNQFRENLGNIDSAASSTAHSVEGVTNAVTPMAEALEGVSDVSDGIQETADAVQDMVQPSADTAQNMNKWQNAINSFDSGINKIKQLPSTLKQIATTKLDGLKNSFTETKTRASELAANVKNLAQTKVTSLVSSFRTFQSTVSEGKTGVSGLITSLKNVGKISVASTVNGFKGLVTQAKNFVGVKISKVSQAIAGMGGPAGIAKAAISGMGSALKTAASYTFKTVITGLGKVGSAAKDAASKIASGIGNTAVTAVKGLATALGAAVTAAGGVVAASINVGKSFEAGMSTVASISGATGEDLAALQAKAKEMGATTAFSATEAASAMEYMAMAGWKTEDMVSGIDGIMNLAAASGSDLATTSDIVTDAITAFGMTAKDSGRFADVMAAASSNANTNVELMGETFKYVGAAAGAMGYSIEDMAVATGLMANSGIKGSQAGTALRATITRMAKPTKESQAAMDALGISLTDSSGNMKAFDEIMVDMRKGMSTMTEDQKASYAAMLGGQEAMSGLLAVANASDEDFNKLTDAINGSAGAAQNMADIKLDNLEGDITILKSGLEGLGIEIYEGINAPLREVTQLATEMVGDLSKAFKEGGFSGLVGEIGTVLSTVVTKIAEYAPQAIDMGVEMGVEMVDSLLTGIQNNAPAIGKGAASTVTAFVGGIIKLIPNLALTGVSLLTGFITGITTQLPEMLTTGSETMAEFNTGLQEALPKLATAAYDLLKLLVSTIITNLPQMLDSGASALTSFINGITSMLPSIISTALQLITTLASGIAANLPQIITAAVNLVLTLAQGIISMLPTIVQSALQLVLSLAQGIISNLPTIISAAVQMITSFISGIVTMLPEIINAAISLVTSLAQGLIANLPLIISSAVELVFALISGLIQAIPDLIMAVPQLVGAIIDTIMSTDWLEVGGNIIKGIGSGLIEGVKNIGSSIKEACSGIKDSICGFFGIHSPSRLMNDLVGTNMALGISEGFTDTMAASADTMTKAVPTDFGTDTTLKVNTDVAQAAQPALENVTPTEIDRNLSMTATVIPIVPTELDSTATMAVNADTSAIDSFGNMASSIDFTNGESVAPTAIGETPVNAAGVTNNDQSKKSTVQIIIEKILLEGVGTKDPKELVNEIMAALYERLSGADEVLSDGEMGALL